MREILFKAKRIDNGEWVEGSFVKAECLNGIGFDYVIIEVEATGNGHIIDKSTLCQYTGLTDKNGNMIWENDILSGDDVNSLVSWVEDEARFVIEDYGTQGCLMPYGYDEDAGRYGVVDTNGFDDFCNPVSEFLEVIGNIFDNPELLEGGAV